jgi:YegS/Rv2252/BmrU family lipid kinase
MSFEEKRKLLFIINPVAGNGKTIEMLPMIKDKMMAVSDQIEYHIHISKNIGDITTTVKKFYESGFNEFIAIGGDGSLSELINGFEFPSSRIPSIGMIPMGTGNDFVKTTSNNKDFDNIFKAIIGNHKKIIDVGIVNNFNFINVCSFGIDGPIMKDMEKYKKLLPGQASYLFSTLKAGISFKSSFVKVVADDQVYDGKMLLIAIGNGKYFGGGMNICPEADLSDGLLEVCLVRNVSKLKFIKEISKIYSGRLNELKEVIYLKAKKITIHVEDSEYLINADGNLMGSTPATLSLCPKGVNYFTID